MSRYEDIYEDGYQDGRKAAYDELEKLVNYLTGVLDEVGCLFVKDENMTEDDHKGVAMVMAALKHAREVL